MAEASHASAMAIAQLEQANKRLLECAAFDPAGLEAALAERDEAVRTIAANPVTLEEPLAERLLRAFEDGRLVRQKLAAFYCCSDADLRRLERIRASDATPPEAPAISAVG